MNDLSVFTPSSSLSTFDDLFNWTDRFFDNWPVYKDSFPPMNSHLNADGSLDLEFALAGYKKDEIKLDVSGGIITLTLQPRDKKEEVNYDGYFRQSIKHTSAVKKYQLPKEKFDETSITAKLEDGILKLELKPLAKKEIPSTSIEIQ